MPIFEYRCRRCGQVFERLWQGAERPGELRCPQCGAEGPDNVEKIVSLCAARPGVSTTDGACTSPA